MTLVGHISEMEMTRGGNDQVLLVSFYGNLVTGRAMLTREKVFKKLNFENTFLMLTVTDRTGELHYHC